MTETSFTTVKGSVGSATGFLTGGVAWSMDTIATLSPWQEDATWFFGLLAIIGGCTATWLTVFSGISERRRRKAAERTAERIDRREAKAEDDAK